MLSEPQFESVKHKLQTEGLELHKKLSGQRRQTNGMKETFVNTLNISLKR